MYCPHIQKDMNGDGVQTVTDFWMTLSAAYHWPGHRLIEIISSDPNLAKFFELNPSSCDGWWAFALATSCWFLMFVMLLQIAVWALNWLG